MGRKRKEAVEVQFDENGNPIANVAPEPAVNRQELKEIYFQVEVVAQMTSWGSQAYPNPLTWGTECFTVAQVGKNCLRLDVGATSVQISRALALQVEAGVLTKASSKLYCYNQQHEADKEDFKALLEALRPGRFPIH